MIINTTLIRINHANKCLNTELKLVDENAPYTHFTDTCSRPFFSYKLKYHPTK